MKQINSWNETILGLVRTRYEQMYSGLIYTQSQTQRCQSKAWLECLVVDSLSLAAMETTGTGKFQPHLVRN